MRGANTRRPGPTPRAAASFLKFCSAVALSRSSHNTLPSTACNSRIQTTNTSGVIFLIGPRRQRAVVARQRLVEPPQLSQRTAAVVEGIRIVGLERERFVVARQRLVEPFQLQQRIAAVVEGIRIVGLERERLVVARQRLVEPFQLLQRIAAVVMRRGNFGIYL